MREFDSISDFVAHLRTAAARASAVESQALQHAARIVQEEAVGSLGEYQSAAGPFAAWAPLSEYTLNGWDTPNGEHYPGKIELGFAPPDNPLLRTGELRSAIETYHTARYAIVGVPDQMVGDGTHESPYRNIGDVAVDLELGTRYMPPRSFLGRALFVRTHEVVHLFSEAVRCSFAGTPFRPVAFSTGSDDPPF